MMKIGNKVIDCFRNPVFLDGVILFFIGIFMFSVLWRDAHSPWAFTNKEGSVTDNYFIALNAKNISQGKGWGLYNGYEFVPFEREISTGPVVFLPVALMLHVITDPDDARYLGVMLLCITLFLALLIRLKIFFSPETYRGIFLLMPFVLLAFMREQWYLVLGEVAASLLLLTSATYAAEEKSGVKNIYISGLFAGMALMSKLISILCSPWIFMALLVLMISRHGWKSGIKNLLPWFGGFFVVPGLVAIWHFAAFGGSLSKLIAYSLDYLQYYFGLGWTGKIESTFCPDPDCLRANFYAATTSWPNAYGYLLAGLTLLTPVAGVFLLIKKNKKPADILLIMFALMCAAQFLFFYFNGIHKQSRYYFIGGFIGLFTVTALLLTCLNQLPSIRFRMGALIILFVAAVAISWPLYRDQGLNNYHRDIKDVANYINHSAEVDEVLWLSFGSAPFPFSSYYMDNKKWWNVYGFIGNKFNYSTEKLQAEADFYWKDRHNYYILQEKWHDNPISADTCAIEHFRNEHFRILECSPAELEAYYVVLSGGKMRFPKPGA